MTPKRKQVVWIMKRDGRYAAFTARSTRRETMLLFLRAFQGSWRTARRAGWSVVKVELREIK